MSRRKGGRLACGIVTVQDAGGFVGLDTNPSPPVAHIPLIGTGASGTADVAITN